MKKSYMKPVASNVVFAMNENIASSVYVSNLYYVSHDNFDGVLNSCNQMLASYGVDCKLTGNITDFGQLVQALTQVQGQISQHKYDNIMSDIQNNQFRCWKA